MPQPIGTDAVSRLSAPRPHEDGGAWRLLMFMGFVFVVFVLSYLGLIFGYQQYVDSQITLAQGELDALGGEVTPEQQEQLLGFEFRLSNLKNLLANHTALTPLLTLIEANTHQQVSYRTLDVSITERRMNLQLTAPSYDVMAEQLAAFENLASVERLQVGGMKTESAGKVTADAVLFFDKKVFAAPLK